MNQAIILIAIAVAVCVLVGFVAAMFGRRSGRRAISQRLASLGTRLGLDPPEDEYNVETSLAYLEQVTGGAAQAVTESSSDAIRLRRSLDTLTQGVVLCDENGTVIYRNGRANALMVSRHGDALAAQAVTDVLEDAWHEGSAERTLDLYGPPRRTLQVRARQIDDGRRPLGVIALIEDVSERRRLEEIRRDFVANVSHELKTPVGALALLAETIEDAADDAEAVRRFAGRMRQEAARLTFLVQDLITLSRIQAAEPVPDPRPVALDVVVAEALDRCRMKANARGITLASIGVRGLSVLGEEELLVTAVRNLLENAVVYSPERTRVVVCVKKVSEDGVEISVADQGIGIPERDLERVFERFYRVDPARSRATGGTGLGLAIVKHVTAAHGGRVTVRSVEGAGSTFILWLPLRSENDGTSADRTRV
jgi:two-component system sensor histidine kinase SenX3